MRSFLRAMKVDLRRSLLSGAFLMTVLLMLLMQFLGAFATITNRAYAYPCWQWILSYVNTYSLHAETVLFIGAVCYSWSYCRDRDSGFYEQAIRRVGLRAYCLSRIVTAILSAFLAGVLSICLFTLYLLSLDKLGRPGVGLVGQLTYLTLVWEGRTGLFFLFSCVHTGMLCGLASVLGLAVSSFVPNTHVAIFSPYLLYRTAVVACSMLRVQRFRPFILLFSQCFQEDIRSFLFMVCVMLDLMVIAGYIFFRRAERRQ